MMSDQLMLYGRMIITGNIEVKTGLHIGATESMFAIGKKDKGVIANPINGQPYIPGSSLRGKLRSLSEKYQGKVKGQKIHQGEIHACDQPDCSICLLYGRTATEKGGSLTRLIVRDVQLLDKSAERLSSARTDLPFTEIKTEVAIDRVTSQANPRTIERVPAGAVFGPMELVISFFSPGDISLLDLLLDGMALLQDDYLGGHGSRGYGKVEFTDLNVVLKKGNGGVYRTSSEFKQDYATLETFSLGLDDIKQKAQNLFTKS